MDLVAINQAIFDEFHRITGITNRFLFPMWFAEAIRTVVRGLHENHASAMAIWGRHSTLEQRELVFRYLRAQPPARWPDIRLIVDNAYSAAGARGELQALLDGAARSSRAA